MGSHFLLPQTHHTESAINVRMTLAMSRLFQPFSPRIIALIPPLVPPVPRHPRQTRSVPPRRQSDHQSALAAARGSRKLQEWAVRGRTTDGGADEPGENPVKEGEEEKGVPPPPPLPTNETDLKLKLRYTMLDKRTLNDDEQTTD